MKILKTAQYKNRGRKELALELLEWHGGQWSPLYSVGSSWFAGKDVPNNIIEDAILELEENIQNIIKEPQAGRHEDRDKSIRELRNLQDRLKMEMGKI